MSDNDKIGGIIGMFFALCFIGLAGTHGVEQVWNWVEV